MIQQFIDILTEEYGISAKEIESLLNVYEHDRPDLMNAVLTARLIPEQDLLEILGRIYHLPVTPALEPDHVEDTWTKQISRNFLKKPVWFP